MDGGRLGGSCRCVLRADPGQGNALLHMKTLTTMNGWCTLFLPTSQRRLNQRLDRDSVRRREILRSKSSRVSLFVLVCHKACINCYILLLTCIIITIS